MLWCVGGDRDGVYVCVYVCVCVCVCERERERERGGGGKGGGRLEIKNKKYTQRKMSVQKSSKRLSQIIWHTIKITVICL